METLLREYARVSAKLSSFHRSAVTKGLGITALVYIFQTRIADVKDCLGHSQVSQLCAACEKRDLIVLDRLQNFCELMT